MNEYRIECFIADDTEKTKFNKINDENLLKWKITMEERALFEFYNRKIIINLDSKEV